MDLPHQFERYEIPKLAYHWVLEENLDCSLINHLDLFGLTDLSMLNYHLLIGLDLDDFWFEWRWIADFPEISPSHNICKAFERFFCLNDLAN
jgi:hypothetical protein